MADYVFATVDWRDVVKEWGIDVDLPAYVRVAVDGEELVAVYGLAWGGGRCWLFFHVENYRPNTGLIVRREAGRCFRKAAQLGEREIFTPRDRQYPTSERLLKLLGFHFHAVENDQEVWRRTIGGA